MQKIILKGNYSEIGRQYGQFASRKIRLMSKMTYYLISLYKKPGAKPFKPNLWYAPLVFLNGKKEIARWDKWASDYLPFLEKYNPDSIDFLKGLAEGAGISFERALFLNISTEALVTCSIWGANGTSTKEGEPFIGMNADEVKSTQGLESFIDVQPENGYRYKCTSMYGWFMFNHGMNEHGLTVASTLLFLNNPEPKPRPPLVIYQKLLSQCKNVAEAKKVFEEIPESNAGYVFYVADKENLLKIEASSQVKQYHMIQNGVSGNTNLATLSEIRAFDEAPGMKDNENMNARYRAQRMDLLLNQYNGQIDYETMFNIASDHGCIESQTENRSICQHTKFLKYNVKTLVSFIAQPKQKRFWYCEGNPCENEMIRVSF